MIDLLVFCFARTEFFVSHNVCHLLQMFQQKCAKYIHTLNYIIFSWLIKSFKCVYFNTPLNLKWLTIMLVVWILIWLNFVSKLANNKEFHKYRKLKMIDNTNQILKTGTVKQNTISENRKCSKPQTIFLKLVWISNE